MRNVRRYWLLLVAAVLTGCLLKSYTTVGRPCGPDVPCGPGAVCDLAKGVCVAAPDHRGPAGDQWITFPDLRSGVDSLHRPDGGCPPGTTDCQGYCFGLDSDMLHCGSCQNACFGKTADRCQRGKCSCGGSGVPCANGLVCVGGACICVPGSQGLCSGCCASRDACVPLGPTQSPTSCGRDGLACRPCDDGNDCTINVCAPDGSCAFGPRPDGVTCAGGRCFGGRCCKGCWDGSVCRAGTALLTCGGQGAPCSACSSVNPCEAPDCTTGICLIGKATEGSSCTGGKCYKGSCCTGCWNGLGCVSGTSDTVCGGQGSPCADCTTIGGACASGACTGCTGCVSGTSCVGGDDLAACGSAGVPCSSCVTPNECRTPSCTSGACSSSARADGSLCASNSGKCYQGVTCCKGCWDGSACVTQISDATCGAGGNPCVDCLARFSLCSGGMCSGCTGCVANLPTGPACVAGNSLSQCGIKGAPCAPCTAPDECKVADCSTGTCLILNKPDDTSCSGGKGKCRGGACCTSC